MPVAIVHDYLTQRGGAERVVVSLTKAFPEAPVYTALYEPAETFPDFVDVDIRTTVLDRLGFLRRRHRLALPLLAPAFSHLSVDATLVICSSSGWAHGAQTKGRKIVYCHAPARWLYQSDRYAPRRFAADRLALAALRPSLLHWDRRAAATADRYLANSTMVADQVRTIYGIEAEIVEPPWALDPLGPQAPLSDIPHSFFLCIARLLPYKNVGAVIEAFASLPNERLIVVGDGPQQEELRRTAPGNVRLVGSVSDDVLRWLYAGCAALVAAAYEDFGLTPLEAASFGKPTAALRFGGYLDTVIEGRNGVFFARPEPAEIRAAVVAVAQHPWNADQIAAHAERFSEARFVERIRKIADLELDRAGRP